MTTYGMLFWVAVVFLLLAFLQKRRRTAAAVWKMRSRKKQQGERLAMKELANSFIGEKCIVYTISSNDGSIQGVIREIGDSGLLLERTSGEREAINLDFVTRIRAYPRKKNGKEKSVILD